jgi:hypothetical protein
MKHVLRLLLIFLFWFTCRHFSDKALTSGNQSEMDQFFLSNSLTLILPPCLFSLYSIYHIYLSQRNINRFLPIISNILNEIVSIYNFTFGIYFLYLTIYSAEETRVKNVGSFFEFHDLDFGITIVLYLLLFILAILSQTVIMLLFKLFRQLDYFHLSWQSIPKSFNILINLFLILYWF